MLKIKAEKMGELEKFGFTKCTHSFEYEIDKYDYYGGLYIDRKSRIFEISGDISCEIGDKLLKKIYDLIKADMVEVCDD